MSNNKTPTAKERDEINRKKYQREISVGRIKDLVSRSAGIEGTLSCLADILKDDDFPINRKSVADTLRMCALQASIITKDLLERLAKERKEEEDDVRGTDTPTT